MNGQRENFYLDLKKLQQLQKQQGFNDSELSLSVGMCESWLHTVKASDKPKIDLGVANLVANKLNCALQDIGEESEDNEESKCGYRLKDRPFNPIIFDYEVEASILFEELLPKNSEMIAAFLRFLKSADDRQKEDLRIRITELRLSRVQNESITYDSWWKFLFVSKLSEALVEKIELCRDSNLFDTYSKAVKRETEKAKEDKKQELIQFGKSEAEAARESEQFFLDADKQIALMKRIVSRIVLKKLRNLMDDADLEKEILDSTSESCAKFLVSYSTKATLDYELMAQKYKRGMLF